MMSDHVYYNIKKNKIFIMGIHLGFYVNLLYFKDCIYLGEL